MINSLFEEVALIFISTRIPISLIGARTLNLPISMRILHKILSPTDVFGYMMAVWNILQSPNTLSLDSLLY